jgi:exodeoxyribonuclease V gamma subunit
MPTDLVTADPSGPRVLLHRPVVRGASIAPIGREGRARATASVRPVLHVYAADGVQALADELASVLAAPLPDALQADWVAVPTLGLSRWLRIALSRHLGADVDDAGRSRGDGVTANIAMPFPGALRECVLAAGRGTGEDDPWRLPRVVWALVDVLHEHADDPVIAPIAALAPGATRYGRARRIADRFDRYLMHRPGMLRAWAAGRDVDGAQHVLARHDVWQPHLWRLLRARIASPSPAEALPDLLARVRAGTLSLDLPPRLALFGLTTLPGGAPFLDVVSAVATQREVHLFLLTPSPGLVTDVYDAVQRSLLLPGPLRSDDPTGAAVSHPLLRSWARPNREAIVLLTGAEARGVPRLVMLDDEQRAAPPSASVVAGAAGAAGPARGPHLLGQVQHGLRAAVAPAGNFVPAEDDWSVQLHSCHGPARQVEVMRDAVLHALADDPTLAEDDIVIFCPAIEQYAPLIEAAFGPPAHDPGVGDGEAGGLPRLAYRVTDWSLRDGSMVLGGLASLLDLLAGRFRASSVLDFLALPAVRLRFGFTDDELATIAGWVRDADVKWGIDGSHRSAWGIPDAYAAGSWQAALDRLLLGVAVADDELDLAIGDVLPFGVEGDGIEVVGRLAEALSALASLAAQFTTPRPLDEWCATLTAAASTMFLAPGDEAWQFAEVRRLLRDLARESVVAGTPSTVALTLADVRRVFVERLQGAPRRPDFFRGGITVSSLTPLRGIPFRVVGLLGMDDAIAGSGGVDGDDLMAAAPHIGDRDARAELRQTLLEAVLAAEDRLIITRTGRNVITNLEVPPAVPIAELRDTVLATVAPDHRDRVRAVVDVVHPRQAFDERNFQRGALVPDRVFSFDPLACEAAGARHDASATRAPFLEAPLPREVEPVLDLADLHQLLRHPVKRFLRRELQVRLPEDDSVTSDDLPISLAGLERWHVAERVIQSALAGRADRTWIDRELARGALPAGVLGVAEVDTISATVTELVAAASSLGHEPGRGTRRAIDVELHDGTRIVGTVRDAGLTPPGPMVVTFSRQSPKHTMASWLDLMALTATDPDQPWQAVSITRGATDRTTKSGAPRISVELLRAAGDDAAERRERALDALAVVVDLHRRDAREPVPVFAKLSRGLADGTAKPSQWHSDRPFGGAEGDDPANAAVYGHLTLRELEALPVRADDPPGPAHARAQRFAQHLWGAIERSTVALDLEDLQVEAQGREDVARGVPR